MDCLSGLQGCSKSNTIVIILIGFVVDCLSSLSGCSESKSIVIFPNRLCSRLSKRSTGFVMSLLHS